MHNGGDGDAYYDVIDLKLNNFETCDRICRTAQNSFGPNDAQVESVATYTFVIDHTNCILIGDGEFLSELSNLLQSADRLDRMMRSDEGQPGRLLDQISKYDSIHDLGQNY